MNAARNTHVGIVCLVTTILANESRGFAAEASCPSADDVPYVTQVGDSWYSLAARAYCLNGTGDSTNGAKALHEYNRGRAAFEMPQGVSICVPKHLHGPFFDVARCAAGHGLGNGSSESETLAPAKCGNDRRENGELCDGLDLGGQSCASLNLHPGALQCRMDCQGFDASHCSSIASTMSEPQRKSPTVVLPNPARRRYSADKPQEMPPRVGLSLTADGGLFVPFTEVARAALFGPLGMGRVGARFSLGFVELGLHGYASGNREQFATSPVDQFRTTLLVGGGLQLGIPIPMGRFRIVPGMEALRLWGQQTVELPVEFTRATSRNEFSMTLLGAYLRTEYRFQRFSRLVISLEVAIDATPQSINSLAWMNNGQMKILGGLSHVAF